MKLVAILILMLSHNPLLQGAERQFSVRVSISASSELAGRMKSYFTRQLRSLKDVTLVETNEVYLIEVNALPIHSGEGVELGIAFSCSYLWNSSVDIQHRLPNYGFTARQIADVQRALGRPYLPIYNDLSLCPAGNLRAYCERIVNGFDAACLSDARKGRHPSMSAK